jgi:hypothetical protein
MIAANLNPIKVHGPDKPAIRKIWGPEKGCPSVKRPPPTIMKA